VADALLHLPDSPLDVQYFCAQTLKKKAQRDFEELPQGAAPCASLILPSPHRPLPSLPLPLSMCASLSGRGSSVSYCLDVGRFGVS